MTEPDTGRSVAEASPLIAFLAGFVAVVVVLAVLVTAAWLLTQQVAPPPPRPVSSEVTPS
jgi:hypothetical protein